MRLRDLYPNPKYILIVCMCCVHTEAESNKRKPPMSRACAMGRKRVESLIGPSFARNWFCWFKYNTRGLFWGQIGKADARGEGQSRGWSHWLLLLLVSAAAVVLDNCFPRPTARRIILEAEKASCRGHDEAKERGHLGWWVTGREDIGGGSCYWWSVVCCKRTIDLYWSGWRHLFWRHYFYPIHRGLYSLKSDFETFSQAFLFKFIILQYMAFPRYASIIITSDNQNCTTQSWPNYADLQEDFE